MGNNGWVEMTLRPDRGVDLLYVDWLGAKRLAISFARDAEKLVPAGAPREFPGRETANTTPELHRPRA